MTKPGKSIADDIFAGVESVTKEWTKQRKAEERRSSARWRRAYIGAPRYTVKDAAWHVMERPYLQASANDTLPATARQVMYAARPQIQKDTGRQLDDQYFTQVLLPDYIEDHGVDWDVVFDDRGHFTEPHTKRTIGLGTLSVRHYLSKVSNIDFAKPSFAQAKLETNGPQGCYGAVLFVEKEGFLPLFSAVQIEKRFDVGVMSTKGMSVTAARQLVDEICGDHDIPLLLLHDFDKSGFSIAGTFQRDTRRYTFQNEIEIIDLGLRIADIHGLQSEPAFDKGSAEKRRWNLRQNGAKPEEIEFLLTQRVELNAMASDQLVGFVESKLTECGVQKIVPEKEHLAEAFRLFKRGRYIEKMVEEELKKLTDPESAVPDDLEQAVQKILAEHPEMRWIDAVRQLVPGEGEEQPAEGEAAP
jgi:hypothetical protein